MHSTHRRLKAATIVTIMAISISIQAQPFRPDDTPVRNNNMQVKTEEIFIGVEVMPQFPGGEKELTNFILKHLRYPESLTAKAIEGKVILRFVINKEGKAVQAAILRSLHPLCDEEVLRIIELMPTWTPGKQNGKNVSVYYTLPVYFDYRSLSEEESKVIPAQIIESPHTKPAFGGGVSGLKKFTEENQPHSPKFTYGHSPDKEKEVIIRFVVNKEGRISNISIVHSINPNADQEAVSIIRKMPRWTPATYKGERVAAYATLTFTSKPS